jgi:hypothetical protein
VAELVTRGRAFAAGVLLTVAWVLPGDAVLEAHCPQASQPGPWAVAVTAAFWLTVTAGGFAGVMIRGYRAKVLADRVAGLPPPRCMTWGACWPAPAEPSKRELPNIGSPK